MPLRNVSHLGTAIAGTLRGPAPSALELAARLHPTPAVAGTPRDAALAHIAAVEGFDRGRYAGPVGWVDASGNGEWAVGMVRATGGTKANAKRFTDGQALLGEPLWRPPSPKGFPDDEASWMDGVGRRLDIANNFAERLAGTADPQAIIEDVFASEISPEVKQAVGRAESRQQALALLFMSADFQRR